MFECICCKGPFCHQRTLSTLGGKIQFAEENNKREQQKNIKQENATNFPKPMAA